MEEHGNTTPPRHGAGNSVDIAAPHKLTEDEASELRTLMKGELNIVDEEEDDDADTFLEYALDLIDLGETANHVMEELQTIGTNLFDETTTQKVSLILSDFLRNMKNTSPTITSKTSTDETVQKPKSLTPQKQLNVSSRATPKKKDQVQGTSNLQLLAENYRASPKKKNLDEVQSIQQGISNLTLLAENYRRRASEGELYPSDKDATIYNKSNSTGSRVHFDVLDSTQWMEIRSSRKLNTFEAETVFEMMKAQLNITNDEDDADADTLLMYALDIVDEGQSVEKVIEEIDMLEMSVCNAKAAQNVALVLSKYLYSLGFSSKFVVDSSPKAMVTKNRGDLEVLRSGAQSMKMLRGNYLRRASSGSSELNSDCDEDELIPGSGEKVDLSAKASPKKVRKELEFLRKSSEGSRQSKMEKYQNALDSSLREDNDDIDISDYSHVREKQQSLDFSAQAASKKHVSELADMTSGLSLADKMAKYNKQTERDKMYFTSGSVVSINGIERNWNKSKTKDENLKWSKSNKEEEEAGDDEDPLYLSAQAASVKQLSELRSIQVRGLPQPKEAIYNELGELKQWGTEESKVDADSVSKCVDVSTKKYTALIGYDAVSQRSEYYDNAFQKKAPSIESQRREELQAIMQDKTLGKVERGKKIEEVKLKYSLRHAAEIDRERNKAMQEIVKDRTLKKGERIKRMKELKRVYDEKLLLC